MTNLLKRIKANAQARNTNGAATLELIALSAAECDKSGDWTNLAWIIALGSGEASRLKAIVSAIGYDVKADKKQPTGLRLKKSGDDGDNNAARFSLSYHVERKTSFRSKALSETHEDGDVIALLVRESKAWTIEGAAMALAKRAKKEGVSGDVAAAAMLAALKEVYNAE